MNALAPIHADPAAADHPERQYLNLLADILENGVQRGDRTGTGTLGVFGRQIRFCLLYTSPSPRDRTRSRMPSSA